MAIYSISMSPFEAYARYEVFVHCSTDKN